jgi:sec-independent protein translocase protein TatC
MPSASPPHSEEPSQVDHHAPRKANGEFDPDHYRMTIGEHLEELRTRLVWALLGFVIATGACLYYGRDVMTFFCRPLIIAQQEAGISPHLQEKYPGETFMVFIQISLISAAVISAPWWMFQVWQFVAAGLYPHERKYVTRHIPLSIGLMLGGCAFVYFVVLPWTLTFFINFTLSVQLPDIAQHRPPPPQVEAVQQPATYVQMLPDDPAQVHDGQIWFNATQGRLKVRAFGATRIVPFGSENLVISEFELPEYVNMVLGMLIIFGLSFQMPLIVLALERIGIADVAALKAGRRYVYFVLVIIAAVITPGDVITATVALLVPLILLYELGIWLSQIGKKNRDAAAT